MPINFGQPISMYVDPGSVKISETLRKRYSENFAAADELQRQLDVLNAADFEGDQQLKKQLEKQTRDRLEMLADRGDYENLSLAVARYGSDFQKQYSPIKDNYERYQQYRQQVQEMYDEGVIDAETYKLATPASSEGYSGLKLDNDGNVDPDSYFSGMNLVKDVNITEMVNEAAKNLVADKDERESASVAQGPGGSLKITTSQGIETVSPERVKKIYQEVINRPDVKAALAQKAKLRTFNLSEQDQMAAINDRIEFKTQQINELQQALNSDQYSEDQKRAIKKQMVNVQSEIDEMKNVDADSARQMVQNLEIQSILNPIEQSVLATNSYTQTTSSRKVDYDDIYLAQVKSNIVEQREIRKEQRQQEAEADAGYLTVKDANKIEYNGYSDYESFETYFNTTEDNITALEAEANNEDLSDQQRSSARAQVVKLKNDQRVQKEVLKNMYLEAQSKDPKLLDVNFNNPYWYETLSEAGREAIEDIAKDDKSNNQSRRVFTPEYMTSDENKIFKNFENNVKEYYASGLPPSMVGYPVPETGNVDIASEGATQTLGQAGYAGAKIKDVAITAGGVPGAPSDGEFVLVTLDGENKDGTDVTGTQVVIPANQFNSTLQDTYRNKPMYKLSRRMNQIRVNQVQSSNFDAITTVTVTDPDTGEVRLEKRNIGIEMTPDTTTGDQVIFTYPDGTRSKKMSLEEASSLLEDGNITDIQL